MGEVVKTRGEVIRESNESLAKALNRLNCSQCYYRKANCDGISCINGIIKWLDQPVEVSE